LPFEVEEVNPEKVAMTPRYGNERTQHPILDEFGREARLSPESIVERFKSELADIRNQVDRNNAGPGFPQAGLSGLLNGVFGGSPWQPSTIAQPYTLANANAYVPLSLNLILLSYSYMTQGLIQTVVTQPVDDAFRGGVKLKTGELEEKDLATLHRVMKRNQPRVQSRKMARSIAGWVNYNAGQNLAQSDWTSIKQALYWARLYGGGGLVINTDQLYSSQLDVDAIREDSPLMFIPADRWELVLSNINIFDPRSPIPFNYYGYPLHTSRVMKVVWNPAPAYIRMRLQGWGMSEVERCIRSINSFLKFENLIFELLDEAKVDVYKIENFNAQLLSPAGTANVTRRIQMSNQLKNFNNALVMDMKDDYEQKQLGGLFAGLSDAWEQLRLNLCSDLKIPRNKLFGESAGGFSSGEDALENYNSTVESLRETAEPLVLDVAALRCQQQFGFVPDDLEVEWPSLRVMKQTEEEEVKTSKQKRQTDLYDKGIYSDKETAEALKKEGILVIDCDVLKGKRKAVAPAVQQEAEFAAEAERRQGKDRAMGGKKPAKKAA
jgi:uncharacterized protein